MGRMEIKGVDQRTIEARAAMNRLHWELQYALDQGEPLPGTGMDLVEVLAIARQIGRLLDQHFPTGDPRRHKIDAHLEFMTGYHEVPR